VNDLITVDLAGIMEVELQRSQRPDDGKLHPSSHLAAPLRHAQLDRAGAPKKPRPFAEEMTLHIGTSIHEWLHDTMRRQGVPYMAEVTLTPWMQDGWAGTADAIIWQPDYKAFVLVDFKTAKGESLRFRRQGGASEDHILQTSVYWHALKRMGIPLVKKIGVLYIPKNAVRSPEPAEPLMVDFDPLPVRALNAQMAERKKKVDRYVSALPKPNPRPLHVEEFLTDTLAPEQEMEQRAYFDRASGDQVLKLVPHWSAAYCPFPTELCGCGEQRSTTIGRWRNESPDSYEARKGYEEIQPVVSPG
jgi:hypothetical protein